MFFLSLLLISSALIVPSCCESRVGGRTVEVNHQKDTLEYTILGIIDDGNILIRNEVDLKGGVCVIPKGVIVNMVGGLIKNGEIVGQETVLKYSGKVFDKVTITGTWNIPIIKSSMFCDLNYENSLRDVIALTNPSIHNDVIIEEGDYVVSASTNKSTCLTVNSNTDLVINGTIRLEPNNLEGYEIIRVEGENIIVKGHGEIIGDKETHTGNAGEWGMGVRFHQAKNAIVTGITIKDCWGDCIYVGGKSKNIAIESCLLDNGRRQGISITCVDTISIKDCHISNVKGKRPQYGIDIEPNSGDSIDNVKIENIIITNCVGGFATTISDRKVRNKAYIGRIEIRNSTINANRGYPVRFHRCSYALLENCIASGSNRLPVISVDKVKDIFLNRNNVIVRKSVINTVKNTISNTNYQPINIVNCKKINKTHNQIVER